MPSSFGQSVRFILANYDFGKNCWSSYSNSCHPKTSHTKQADDPVQLIHSRKITFPNVLESSGDARNVAAVDWGSVLRATLFVTLVACIFVSVNALQRIMHSNESCI